MSIPPYGQPIMKINVPCQSCGHKSNWGLGAVDVVAKWLTNDFPPCKVCGEKIDSTSIAFPFKNKSVILANARKKIRAEGKIEVEGLVFPD